jgi:hypothetical protein
MEIAENKQNNMFLGHSQTLSCPFWGQKRTSKAREPLSGLLTGLIV